MRCFQLIAVSALLGLVGCGDDGGGTGADANLTASCGFSSDSYLPFELGYNWTYEVTDLATGIRTDKTQKVTDVSDGVMTQETTKVSGRTVGTLHFEGDAMVRTEQTDYDELDVFERKTLYEPYKLRLDESAEKLVAGVTWDETFTRIEQDEQGVETARIEQTDRWEVISASESCTSPFGTFECLHVRKVRIAGGVANKVFWYAPGIGKVREEGGQTEVLSGCSVQ